MKIALPFRGELGLLCRYHVPAVHALMPDIACVESGTEALFPSAGEHLVVDRNLDDRRRDLFSKDAAFLTDLRGQLRHLHPGADLLETYQGMSERWFVPEPVVRRGIEADVVICPRQRRYGASKNWKQWRWLAAQLELAGTRVFAGGAPDSSDGVLCPAAWHYARFLDATIEAMLRARLVIATASGLAVLALLCGRPLLLITAGGRVAPGPVVDERGRVMQQCYGPVPRAQLLDPVNHHRAPIYEIDGWHDPEDVLAAAISIMATEHYRRDRVTRPPEEA